VVDGRPLTRAHMYTVVSEVYQAQATGHRQEKDEGLRGHKTKDYTYYLLFFVYYSTFLLSRGCADCWL
jgi:hypothetical protein